MISVATLKVNLRRLALLPSFYLIQYLLSLALIFQLQLDTAFCLSLWLLPVSVLSYVSNEPVTESYFVSLADLRKPFFILKMRQGGMGGKLHIPVHVATAGLNFTIPAPDVIPVSTSSNKENEKWVSELDCQIRGKDLTSDVNMSLKEPLGRSH